MAEIVPRCEAGNFRESARHFRADRSAANQHEGQQLLDEFRRSMTERCKPPARSKQATSRSDHLAGYRKSDPTSTTIETTWLVQKTAERLFLSHFTGTSTGAPLSFTRNTTNFAGWVVLAFRLTTCTSSGLS